MDLFGESAPAPTPSTPAAEPDTLPALPTENTEDISPRATPLCLGHESQEQQILEAFNAGQLPHGLIFSGPAGIGKATFAFRLARFILAHTEPDAPIQTSDNAQATSLTIPPSNAVYRKIAAGAHPDLLHIQRAYDTGKDRFKDSVAVEDIRKIAPFLRMTSSQGGWRVVIVDDADTMNRNAQNALLKILEEPPSRTVLILIAHRMGTLVPTIRSRCRVIGFKALTQEFFTETLQNHGHALAPASLAFLYDMTEGSAGEALRQIENNALEMGSRIMDILKAAPQWHWTPIHALADELTKNGRDSAYEGFREMLLWVFRRSIINRARQIQIPSIGEDARATNTFMSHSSLATLLKICDNLDTHFDTVQKSNLDKRQAVLSAFHLIAA
ncbi:MAG: DNA polymerase III subunit delta' [Alphaproteobacteria bacterium]|nr:DNA polymerase III subunit delta' [Alphaproteobacteria bacterium]